MSPVTPAARGRAGAFALALTLCACTGDLGRPKPNLWSDDLAPALGLLAASARGEAASPFRMTDDEAQLRDRAWRFIMPAHERAVFEARLSDLAHARILPVAAQSDAPAGYHAGLTGGRFVSQASRYNRLAEDAHADRLLIAPFRANATRVVEADRARLATLDASPRVEPDRRDPAQDRVVENEALVLWVCERLRFRLANYRHALDHLVVEMPSREAIRAERAIMALEAEAGPLCALPAVGAFGGAGAGAGGFPPPPRAGGREAVTIKG